MKLKLSCSVIRLAFVTVLSVLIVYDIFTNRRNIIDNPLTILSNREGNANDTQLLPNNFTKSSIFPSRVISVFGLESSGTTFLARTIAHAVGALNVMDGLTWKNEHVEIHHISLPWGGAGERNSKFHTVEAIVPADCSFNPHRRVVPPRFANCTNETGIQYPVDYPSRFFVNITSHIEWYRRRNIDATAVIIVRDYNAHIRAKLQDHVADQNVLVAHEEDEYGRQLLEEAFERLRSLSPRGYEELVVISYETLMFLQGKYLIDLYNRLGIEHHYLPAMKDGNAKYLGVTTNKLTADPIDLP